MADQGNADDDWGAALAEQAASTQAVTPAAAPANVFEPLARTAVGGDTHDIDLIMDIPVQLTVELGRTKIPIKNILQLAQGSVVELDGLAGGFRPL